MRRLAVDLVLHGLERLLPHAVADAIVGDLAEEAPDRSVAWLVSQGLRTLWHAYAPTWRELTAGWALPAGGGAALLVIGAAQSLWHLVLQAVPRRADHLPGTGWIVGALVCAVVAAGAVAGAVSYQARHAPRA